MSPAVTKDAVFAAADALTEAGVNPTQAAVRERLGGGSFSTIGPLLGQWQEQQADKEEARKTPVPEAVRAVLAEAAGRLWREAQAIASRDVEAARREVAEMKAKAQAVETETAEALLIVERERDEAQARVAALSVELAAQRQAREDAELDAKAETRARAKAETEAARQEARAVAAELAKAEADQRAGQAEARTSAASEETERRILGVETKAQKREAELREAAQVAAAKADATLAELQRELTTQRDEVMKLRELAAGLLAERNTLSARVAEEREAAKISDARIAEAEARAAKAEARAEVMQEERKVAEQARQASS